MVPSLPTCALVDAAEKADLRDSAEKENILRSLKVHYTTSALFPYFRPHEILHIIEAMIFKTVQI